MIELKTPPPALSRERVSLPLIYEKCCLFDVAAFNQSPIKGAWWRRSPPPSLSLQPTHLPLPSLPTVFYLPFLHVSATKEKSDKYYNEPLMTPYKL